MRNYTVLKIAVDESRIFVTKTKAPYMICLEVYRPAEEIKYRQNQLQTKNVELMDRLLFKRPLSIDKIITQAEKQLSKSFSILQTNEPRGTTIAK